MSHAPKDEESLFEVVSSSGLDPRELRRITEEAAGLLPEISMLLQGVLAVHAGGRPSSAHCLAAMEACLMTAAQIKAKLAGVDDEAINEVATKVAVAAHKAMNPLLIPYAKKLMEEHGRKLNKPPTPDPSRN